MATLSEVTDEILDEMRRTGELTAQVQTAIKDAIKHYERERFTWNEARAVAVTGAGQEYYGLPSDVIEIDSLTVKDGTSIKELREVNYVQIDVAQSNTQWTGEPAEYAIYDGQLRLYPTPDATYSLMMSYVHSLPELSATSDTNAWIDQGKQLIKYRAKWRLYTDIINEPERALAMKMAEQDALDSLQEKSLRLSTGGGIIPRL